MLYILLMTTRYQVVMAIMEMQNRLLPMMRIMRGKMTKEKQQIEMFQT